MALDTQARKHVEASDVISHVYPAERPVWGDEQARPSSHSEIRPSPVHTPSVHQKQTRYLLPPKLLQSGAIFDDFGYASRFLSKGQIETHRQKTFCRCVEVNSARSYGE